jgi:hypothetical protein
MYVLLYNVMKSGHGWKFLHEFVVVIAYEILANDFSDIYMYLKIYIN